MKQYESSTATLRNILSHSSLQRDKVEETMEAMAEATSEAQEIDDLIRGSMVDSSSVDIDEDELQEELSALIKEAETKVQKKEELRALEGKHRNKVDAESGGDKRPALPSVPPTSLAFEHDRGIPTRLSEPQDKGKLVPDLHTQEPVLE